MKADAVIFGLTIAQFEDISLKILLTALILYMLFIIGSLAKRAKAGRYGTIWLFVALGLGFVGFIAKSIIQYFIHIN